MSDGLSVLFTTRQEAELAIERLVQEFTVDRAAIFAEPVADGNTSGTRTSGGDAASGFPGTEERQDAPLDGEIRLTVPVTSANRVRIEDALREIGGHSISGA